MLNLLIVEDEETMREGLAGMIDWEAVGVRICGVAENGLEALEIIGKTEVDLLLTDIRMPLMDGLQLIGEIRKRERDIACVLVSGYSDFEYAQQALRYGVSDFVVKPCAPREIKAIFARLTAQLTEQRRQSDSVQGWRENMPMLKTQLLRQWLSSPALVTENRREQLRKLKLPIGHEHLIVAVVRIDNRSRQQLNYNRTDLELIRLAAANIVQETLEQTVMQPVATVKEEDGIVVILNGMFEWIGDKLARGLERVQHNLRQFLKIEVSVGISDSKASINQLAEAYQEALQALELRFFLGAERCCYYRDVRMLSPHAPSTPSQAEAVDTSLVKLEQSAADNLRAGLFAETLNDAERWLEALQRYHPHSRTEIQVRTLSFLTRLLQQAPLQRQADGEDDRPVDYGSLEQQIGGIDTMEELAGFVYTVIRQLVERLNPHRTPKRKVQQALGYIASHYNAPGLSLVGVAKELYVSSTYLSTLFKQELGINFLDYVHQYRVEKAKGLLQSADIKIQAVAKEIGYFDEAHFTRTFKKWTGMLPSQYKKEMASRA